MKASVGGISSIALQLLLVAFCFGASSKAAPGSAPRCHSRCVHDRLRFKPFHAGRAHLIANTAPVAWGSIGTPVHMLAPSLPSRSRHERHDRAHSPITAASSRSGGSAMVPWKETFEVLPASSSSGISFGPLHFFGPITWTAPGGYHAGLFSLLCTVVFTAFFGSPRNMALRRRYRAPVEARPADVRTARRLAPRSPRSPPAVRTRRAKSISLDPVPHSFRLCLSMGLQTRKRLYEGAHHAAWLTTEGKPNGGWNTPLIAKFLATSRLSPSQLPKLRSFRSSGFSATAPAAFLAPSSVDLIRGAGRQN